MKSKDRDLFSEMIAYLRTKKQVLENENDGILLLPAMNKKFELTEKQLQRLSDIRIQLELIEELHICVKPKI
jgi:hypothetical protein